MVNEHQKDINTRLKETFLNKAETNRANSVAQLKNAHKQIEEIEKERKRPAVQSVQERIKNHAQQLLILLDDSDIQKIKKSTSDSPSATKLYYDWITKNVKRAMDMYESIRYDYQKVLDIKNEDFERLFPKIIIEKESTDEINHKLMCMLEQELHMRLYADRYTN
jgi:site-specific recombinase XerC